MELTLESQDLSKRYEEQKFALDQSAIVAETDSRGSITYVNNMFCEISRFSREELLGQNHRIVNSNHHPKEFFKNLWATISSGRVWKGEICNRTKDGSLYWVNTTIVPFFDGKDRPQKYLSIRQDITALKLAEQKIVEQQMRLITASKTSAIGEMAAAITHEINNPLGVILGRCEMLKSLIDKGQLDSINLLRLVDTIEVTGKRIEKIVKSMRSLAHQGEQDPMLPTLASGIVDDLKDLCSERFRNHGIQLSFVYPDKDLHLECRSHEILQVLVNLLNNAFDAIDEKNEKRWVRFESRLMDNEIEFSVTDSGGGISPEIARDIFKPFFSTKKVQYGTGLGLSISRNLIQRHQGKLDFISENGTTKFRVLLPLRQAKSSEQNPETAH